VAWREEECEAAQLFSWCVGSGRTDRRCTASAAGVAAEDAMQQHLAMPISSCRAAAVPLSVPLSLSLSLSLSGPAPSPSHSQAQAGLNSGLLFGGECSQHRHRDGVKLALLKRPGDPLREIITLGKFTNYFKILYVTLNTRKIFI